MGRPAVVTATLAAASANNICLSQSIAAAGNLVLNGTNVTAGIATLDAQRRILITSAGNDSGITFTIYGTTGGATGTIQQEVVTGSNASTAASKLDFYTVTRIATSAATASTVTVGTNGVGASPWVMVNYHAQPVNLSFAAVVTGTINYTLQYTYNDFWTVAGPATGGTSVASTIQTAFNDPVLVSLTANAEGTLQFAATGWRVLVNSGTGTVAVTGIQAGIIG